MPHRSTINDRAFSWWVLGPIAGLIVTVLLADSRRAPTLDPGQDYLLEQQQEIQRQIDTLKREVDAVTK